MTLRELELRFQTSGEWNDEDNEELCRMAGLGDEWDTLTVTDGDFESLVYRAAEVLGLDIYQHEFTYSVVSDGEQIAEFSDLYSAKSAAEDNVADEIIVLENGETVCKIRLEWHPLFRGFEYVWEV